MEASDEGGWDGVRPQSRKCRKCGQGIADNTLVE
jgi:hypothetical protein